jgi:hypothetical protein
LRSKIKVNGCASLQIRQLHHIVLITLAGTAVSSSFCTSYYLIDHTPVNNHYHRPKPNPSSNVGFFVFFPACIGAFDGAALGDEDGAKVGTGLGLNFVGLVVGVKSPASPGLLGALEGGASVVAALVACNKGDAATPITILVINRQKINMHKIFLPKELFGF